MKKSVNFNGQGGKRGKASRGIGGFVALAKFVGMKDEEIIASAKNIEKQMCTHPAERIKVIASNQFFDHCRCECGYEFNA